MPVTAKLSRNFYEKLGDEIANELVDWFNQVDATYRADLKEFNELNFQRFDAKLEQRLTAFEAKIETRLHRFESRFERSLEEFDAKFQSQLDSRIDGLDSKFDALNARVDSLERKVDALDNKVDALSGRVDALESKVDALDNKIAGLDAAYRGRFGELEAKLERGINRVVLWAIGLWIATIVPLAGLILHLNTIG